ncbi:MAG TPA: glycerate-2-kinase family protein, partial [Candidatus Ozemobacteraceae bacterium]
MDKMPNTDCRSFLVDLPRLLLPSLEAGRRVEGIVRELGVRPSAIVSIGKASVVMLAAAYEALGADGDAVPALCIRPAGADRGLYSLVEKPVTVLEGGHPFPDEGSFRAGDHLIGMIDRLERGTGLLAMVSGGASALAEKPVEGLSETICRELFRRLVGSGLPIGDLNTVRRHLSAIKGGNLLRRCLERGVEVDLITVSDVPGDQPHDIGSGPFSPDPTRFADALEIARVIAGFPREALGILQAGLDGALPETLKPEQVPAGSCRCRCILSARQAVDAVIMLSGESGERAIAFPFPLAGNRHQWLSRFEDELRSGRLPVNVWMVACGELEVQMPHGIPAGRGGRASSLVLDLARIALFL